MTAAQWRWWIWLAIAILLLVAVPLLPGVLADGSPAGFVRLPWESIVVLLLLALLPWRAARVVVAGAFGLVVVVAVVLAAIDAAYESMLDVHFDPLDWPRLRDAFGVIEDAIGSGAATAWVVVLAVVVAGLAVALSWAALRATAAVRARGRGGRAAASTVVAAWVVAVLLGSQLVPGQPAAAAASFDTIAAAASRAAAGLAAQADLPQEIATDRYGNAPAAELLTALRGKDVIIAFVESYGQVAVQGSSFSGDVDRVLRDGEVQLTADGYAAQSAFLTSPTFGGIRWLAHSTLQTGLRIDPQSISDRVVASDRFTLRDAFAEAG